MSGLRVLFLCCRNRLRSPTAEQLFRQWPGVELDSAGLAPDADTPLSAEQVDWAELIQVGHIEVAKWAPRFDPSRGASLETAAASSASASWAAPTMRASRRNSLLGTAEPVRSGNIGSR